MSMYNIFQTDILNTSDENLSVNLSLFNVTPEAYEEDLNRIKHWYRLQPHLPEDGLDERLLKRILIYNKFNAERAKKKIDNWFTAKSLVPELFSHRDPLCDQMKPMGKFVVCGLVPNLTPNNERILLCGMKPNDASTYDPLIHMTYNLMLGEIKTTADTNSLDIFIVDIKNMTLDHVLKFNPSLVKKLLYTIEACYGTRFAAMYVLNCSPLLVNTLNMVMSFMKKKKTDKVIFLDSLEQLHDKIPKDYLPKDLGGNIPKTTEELSVEFRDVIQSPYWREWLIESEKLKSDESRRLGKADFLLHDHLGTSGTFRKLDID